MITETSNATSAVTLQVCAQKYADELSVDERKKLNAVIAEYKTFTDDGDKVRLFINQEDWSFNSNSTKAFLCSVVAPPGSHTQMVTFLHFHGEELELHFTRFLKQLELPENRDTSTQEIKGHVYLAMGALLENKDFRTDYAMQLLNNPLIDVNSKNLLLTIWSQIADSKGINLLNEGETEAIVKAAAEIPGLNLTAIVVTSIKRYFDLENIPDEWVRELYSRKANVIE